jgi:hypothetical protein
MSKVIAGFSMSLDGFVPHPDDGVDRVFKWYWAGGTDAEAVAATAHSKCRGKSRVHRGSGQGRRGAADRAADLRPRAVF